MKRLFDLIVAIVAAGLSAPLAAITAIAVRSTMGSPVLFRQERPGLDGRPFAIVKFRTMVGGEGDPEERMTPTGAVLRRWSIDEIPTLWNVIRGDMSLVGPRPLLTDYLPLYSEEQSRRHDVRPGVTGVAQVAGRNATTWERRLELDVWYVDHGDLWVDLKVLAITIGRVLSGAGVNTDAGATMPRFEGTPDG